MSTFEHLQEIQKECIDRTCDNCPHFVEASKYRMECLYALAFGDAPYEWNLENLDGILKEY